MTEQLCRSVGVVCSAVGTRLAEVDIGSAAGFSQHRMAVGQSSQGRRI